MKRLQIVGLSAGVAMLSACGHLRETSTSASSVQIERTAHGIPHVQANNLEALAYGVAYAHAQDNVCQTADHLVTVRGQRSQAFGAQGTGMLGVRVLPNEQIDAFIAAHMDDDRLQRLWAASSPDNQALARGYVAGYNRYLRDHADQLPEPCRGKSWVKAMSLADYHRAYEVVQVQAGAGALADAIVAARPPQGGTAALAEPAPSEALAAWRETGLVDSPLGSNAWAFGKEVTANGRGMLLGNPHFPWVGTSRFYQMHLTIPGRMDVMGAAIGLTALVQIGFNKDVAWSHTVSTGKRFTLHELTLQAGDPTTYLVDGRPEKMQSRTVRYQVRGNDGQLMDKTVTLWRSRFGPIMVMPRAGLNWTDKVAYALQDANTGNLRGTETYLGFAQARTVQDLLKATQNLGTSWVNTIGVDRDGRALYADQSVVPDVDAAQLQRCAPSRGAAGLLGAAGIVVLNGSRSDCNWQQDANSPVKGLIAPARMPSVIRSDWVHNSNDSFFYTQPAVKWPNTISPLVGDDVVRRPRTRSEWIEIPELIGRGKVSLQGMQAQLFENRNLMARLVLPDLLAACAQAPHAEARDGCAALKAFHESGMKNDVDARAAHLFREFWRQASTIPGVYREGFDKSRPVETPQGLRMSDAATATKVWDALGAAVKKVRAAGFALDARLGDVQRPVFTTEPIALHGGDEIEGVLNNLGDRAQPGIGTQGIRIDYGSSYIQTVTFDDRGPVAQAMLTYGQSTLPQSPHSTDQLKRFSRKEWLSLPFHPDEVAQQRIGSPLVLKIN